MKSKFFTVGPTQLSANIKRYINEALDNDMCSLSHRSNDFEAISKKTTDNLRRLLSLPNDYHIFFISSGTEGMERTIQNLVKKKSFHLVNGAFSDRFYKTSIELGKEAEKHEVEFGKGFDIEEIDITRDAELICITQNETSTGVMVPVDDINRIKDLNPDKLIAVDTVSSVPYVNLDYSKVDCAFFSVQKGFGLPAGLGVMLVNDKCIEKSKDVKGYHSFASLLKKAEKNQTPETPNVLDIYLLGKVTGDMLEKGIDTIRKETEEKAEFLYSYFADKCFVNDESIRSKTIVVIEDSDSKNTIASLKEKGFVVGSGYGKYKQNQIRISNFPMMSIDDLKELLKNFQ